VVQRTVARGLGPYTSVPLKGDQAGHHSIRVNDQYRITWNEIVLGKRGITHDIALQAIRRAVRRPSSVNIFDQPSATKVDLFVAGGSPMDDAVRIGGSVCGWRRIPPVICRFTRLKTSCCRNCAGSDSETKSRIAIGAMS
jgi:hypothetical protein